MCSFAVRTAVALAVLAGVPGLLDPFETPKADLLVLVALAGGAALALQRLPRLLSMRLAPLDAIVAAWVVIAAASTLLGISPRLSWLGEPGQREGLRTTLALAGVYALARHAGREAREARQTRDAILVAAVVAAAYAMLQCSGHDPIPWAGGAPYRAGGFAVLRPGSTLGNPILLGALLAAALAVVVGRLASGRGERSLLVPAAAVMGTALLATLSRGAMLAAAAAGAGAIIAGARARADGAASRVALALAAPLVPSLAWGWIVLRAPLAARVAEGAGGESSPARVEIARGALALWRSHPVLGVGPDAFGLGFPAVQPQGLWRDAWLGLPVHAHSVPLQVLASGGAFAALVGAAWLALLAGALVRGARAGGEPGTDAVEIGAALVALVIAGAFFPVGLAGATVFVMLSAQAASLPAVAATSTEPPPASAPAPCARHESAPWATVAVALAVALLLAATIAPRWTGLAQAWRARAALEWMAGASQPDRLALARIASESGERALDRAAGEDVAARLACDADLALAEQAWRAGDGGGARAAAALAERAARHALALEPRRASHEQRLGNALAMRALLDSSPELSRRSDEAFERASTLAPRDALILVDAVRARLLAGRWNDAAATAARITRLYPGAATGHALAAAALAAAGRPDEARSAAARALAGRWEEGDSGQRAATEALMRRLAAAR